MTLEVKPLLVTGTHLVLAAPELVDAIRIQFDVEIIDFKNIEKNIQSLEGRAVAVFLARIEFFELFSFVASLLAPTGTTFAHCFAWGPEAPRWTPTELTQLGLCGFVDVREPRHENVLKMIAVCRSCEGHPITLILDHPTFGEPVATDMSAAKERTDDEIADLVSRGFTDREISEMLHFSHQTTRNKISRVLSRSGLRNRTDLAIARLRHALQLFASQDD